MVTIVMTRASADDTPNPDQIMKWSELEEPVQIKWRKIYSRWEKPDGYF